MHKLNMSLVLLACLGLSACRTGVNVFMPGVAAAKPPEEATQSPAQWAQRATVAGSRRQAFGYWLKCAQSAHALLATPDTALDHTILSIANRCTDQVLRHMLRRHAVWSPGQHQVDGVALQVVFHDLSPYLQAPVQLTLASEVSMAPYKGNRHTQAGYGVPLVVFAPRCKDAPLCELLPPEGVARGATAWLEWDDTARPRVVVANPRVTPKAVVAGLRLPLAQDTSAPWARLATTSKLSRLAVWGLLRGNEIGRRAGLYLLEDYDPRKRPVVMIHGLGSSPLIWADLSNALWADPALRTRYQVWHLVYQSNAPLLVLRRRVQGYLDKAWAVLDPDGDDPARSGVVLVGHSLGGVVARLLSAESGNALWNAAFAVPPDALAVPAAQRQQVSEIFFFTPYPGVERAIFLAAPHRGSPTATRGIGRLFRRLVGRRTPEIDVLRAVATAHPEAVRPELRATYQQAWVNSISTLQQAQPVRAAGERLLPAACVRYHTIAGVLPGDEAATDGVVPLASTQLDGAESTLVIASDHAIYQRPEAVEEVLRILHAASTEHEDTPP